ncbi:SlyX family protein [Hansschlegelia sp. KR7-227]|uniref:SlyX family protein n=1 Tax=Hansschlegelia sp. KR7-227 TaxID=3400914 RepID=UPI003BFE6CB8
MADDVEDLARRVDALEERIAHQDLALEALNQTVVGQWTLIDALRRELAELVDRLDDAVSGPGPVDRPPPHY